MFILFGTKGRAIETDSGQFHCPNCNIKEEYGKKYVQDWFTLFFIPIFGQYLKKTNMISINRSEGTAAMRKMLREAKSKMDGGYSIIIFPEGTRKIPGDKPDYKTGFIGIYNETESEILPIAVNSGNNWPKHTFIKTPGKIIIKILKPIPAKLKKDEVLEKIESVIEEETNKIK